jgi:uncharacterized protein with HEPN domain
VIRDPRLYLDDILESIDAIAEYTSNLDENTFRAARLVQDAVLRRLQIIGEAAARRGRPCDDRNGASCHPDAEKRGQGVLGLRGAYLP